MSDFIKSFVKKNKPQFLKYKKYLQKNDWTKEEIERDENEVITYSKYYYAEDVKQKNRVIHDGKKPEFEIQNKIASNVKDRLKYFYKHVGSDIGKNKDVDRLIKNMTAITDMHCERVDKYLTKSKSLEEKEVGKKVFKDPKQLQSDEIDFENTIHKKKSKISDEVRNLDLKKQNEEHLLRLWDDEKAPLSMRKKIEAKYPEIKRKVEKIGIDFDTPPKNEMLIYMEDVPKWNKEKHYFEQDKKTLQFYVDEFKKIERGIEIDGVYISPWMYCHLNIFKTSIPTAHKNPITGETESKDRIINPPLRDNEWFIIQRSYEQAKKQHLNMFLCSTRRGAKTTDITSHLLHKGLSGGETLVVAGSSARDLGQIERNFRVATENINPAFRVPNTSNNWEKEVVMGVKDMRGKNIVAFTLNVVNTDKGGEKAKEKLAGFTPDAFVYDECMKAPFQSSFDAAKPSFDSPYGKRLVAILSGTGNSDFSVTEDAFKMLLNPEEQDILPMDWGFLEKHIDTEDITWDRRRFGTFLPGQMSSKDGLIKKEITLPEYLGIEETEKLNRIKIQVTDWKKAKRVIKEDRKKFRNNKKSLTNEKIYYPIDPEEIFLSGKENPFPQEELKLYKSRLLEEGNTGKNVVLDYNANGEVFYELSGKEVARYPYGGGFHDSPVTIYQDPNPNLPFEFAVAGCLLPGEKVLTKRGPKNVEEVELKDKLINKDGEYVDIINLQRRKKVNEDVYGIRVGGNCRYTNFTKEHPVYVSRPNYYETEKSKNRVKNYNFGKEDFKKAKHLEKGDWVKFPNIYFNKKNEFDTKKIWDKYKQKPNNIVDCPFYKQDFWLFIGTYLGDGWVGKKHKIYLSFSDKEELHKSNCINFIEGHLNRKVYVRKRVHCYEVSFSCKVLRDFLEDNFDKHALNKNIPEWIKKIDDEYKYDLICGYLNSDGCVMNHPKGYIYSKYVSISLKLLEDFQDIFNSLGILSSIGKLRDESVHIFKNGYESKTKKTYQLSISQKGTLKINKNIRKNTTLKIPKEIKVIKKHRRGKESFISENNEYIYKKIIDIKKDKYTGSVYNFECETNTFLTKNITTHNCDGYKQDQSNSDSVGSFVIIRRDTGQMVASYHSRPEPKTKFHRQGLLLLELYKSPVFMENEDMGFKEFTDRMDKTDQYIAKGVDLLGDLTLNVNLKRKFGWQPTPKNKSFFFGIFVNKMNEQEEYEDDKGVKRTRWGFEKIRDVRIIDEMINYKQGGNFDSITACMGAYAYDFYMEMQYGAPKKPMTEEQKRERQEKIAKIKRKRENKKKMPFQKSRVGRKLW